jgi:hypothetical protein
MAWMSLKPQNLPALALVIIAQVSVAYGLSNPDFNWSAIEVFSPDTVVVTLIMLAAALFSSLLPASVKHQLVYLRIKNALPGHRFLQLSAFDPRIDLHALQQKMMALIPLNATEEQQNRAWYQHIYSQLQNESLVRDSHKVFLLWRDSLAVSLIIALLLAIGVFALPAVADTFGRYSFLVSVFFALASLVAAHHSGKRLVTNAVVTWLAQSYPHQKQ